ncbi:MAG: synthetase [Polaromonas sp.]|nr:synthetase [Polaromonas sp.]
MSTNLYAQSAISHSLGVRGAFDAATELAARTRFLVDSLIRANRRSLVLGISGGVDSLVSGLLAQRAVQEARKQGHEARFIAVRLPYGAQADEADAQKCLQVIQPDTTLAVDIKPAVDALRDALQASGMAMGSASEVDFMLGNVKARQRMVVQYAIAGAQGGLVIGTDHAAEALMGFFTKFGDGAADVTPLSGLTKRRVRALGQAMGAPDALVFKTPTADLESLKPLKPDEEAFGVSYEQIDDFLEGKPVDDAAAEIMVTAFRQTAHKRALPLAPLVL